MTLIIRISGENPGNLNVSKAEHIGQPRISLAFVRGTAIAIF